MSLPTTVTNSSTPHHSHCPNSPQLCGSIFMDAAPIAIHRGYLVNVGWSVRKVWALVTSLILDPETGEKIQLLGYDWPDELRAQGVLPPV